MPNTTQNLEQLWWKSFFVTDLPKLRTYWEMTRMFWETQKGSSIWRKPAYMYMSEARLNYCRKRKTGIHCRREQQGELDHYSYSQCSWWDLHTICSLCLWKITQHIKESCPAGWHYSKSKKGWMNSGIFFTL